MDNSPLSNIKFQDKITSPSNGKMIRPDSNASSITIEFETEGTFTANFEVQGITGKFYPIMATNLGTYDSATSTSDKNYLYQVGVVGAVGMRVNIVAISGELTVHGIIRG